MKAKRNLLTLVALVLVGVLCVYAHGDKFAELKAELDLSDAQVAQLQKKFTELEPLEARAKTIKTELEALKAAPEQNVKAIEAKKTELEAVKREWRAKNEAIFRSVLTKEQYAKFERVQAEHEKNERAEREKAEKEKVAREKPRTKKD